MDGIVERVAAAVWERVAAASVNSTIMFRATVEEVPCWNEWG